MRCRKITLALILITIIVAAVTSTGRFSDKSQALPNRLPTIRKAQTDAEKAVRRLDFESRYPVVDYSAPQPDLNDPEKAGRRKNKSRRYDKYSFGISDPNPRVTETSVETEWSLHVPAIPVGLSEVIIIGDIQKAEAFLSNNKKGVYSEFTVRVSEVLKCDDSTQLAPGSLIAVERIGGIVRYPAGNKRLICIEGQNMPRINHQYVLFLNTTESSIDYRLLTGYEVREGQVFPLDNSTRMSAYKGADRETFLNAVRDAITQSPR